MIKGYKNIFWGLFFSIFHITVGGLPILSAFVGWSIIAYGTSLLFHDCSIRSFMKANNYAMITAFISFIGQILAWKRTDDQLSLCVTMVFSIFELLFIYYFFEGSITHLYSYEKNEIASEYQNTLHVYIVIFIINTLLECVALTIASDLLITIYAIIAILLVLWLMYIVNTLKRVNIT